MIHSIFITNTLDKLHWFSHCEADDCGYQGGPFKSKAEAEQDGDEHTLEMAKVED